MIANAERNNETFDHKAGDQALERIGELLKNSLRDADFVARYGGDEFIIQLNGGIFEKDAGVVASNIIKNISKPFHFENGSATIGASIGISVYPKDGTDVDTSYFNYLANYKVFTFVFIVAPYLALKIMSQ